MDIKITGVTFEIMRDALAQAKVAREFILGEMDEVIDAPRAELSKYAPGISSVQDRSREDRAADRQGRRDDPRPAGGVRVPDRRQRRGQVLVYASNRERGDALVDRIRSMTKEVEVGDEFTGKVVKTTTFGAFIELSKGTDGLLHISNVAPGRRIARSKRCSTRATSSSVRVVEVDRERGRIGLRLADDPEIHGKTAEELAAIAAAENGGQRRERGRRGTAIVAADRDRDRDRGGDRDRDRRPRRRPW